MTLTPEQVAKFEAAERKIDNGIYTEQDEECFREFQGEVERMREAEERKIEYEQQRHKRLDRLVVEAKVLMRKHEITFEQATAIIGLECTQYIGGSLDGIGDRMSQLSTEVYNEIKLP